MSHLGRPRQLPTAQTGLVGVIPHPRSDMATTERPLVAGWAVAATAAVGYGAFLTVSAERLPDGAELSGLFPGQPVATAAMALLLAVATLWHPVRRERRWLVGALLFSAVGDFLLALPDRNDSFIFGLGSFLVAHLCFIGTLLPLRGRDRSRRIAAAVVIAASCGSAISFWPTLTAKGLAVPVTAYVTVLTAMVCTALIAKLPTPWTMFGAVCFAASDGMIGIERFILQSRALEVPIWWTYAAAVLLITGGIFFGRSPKCQSVKVIGNGYSTS